METGILSQEQVRPETKVAGVAASRTGIYLAAGSLAMFLWIMLFAAGLTINSAPYRAILAAPPPAPAPAEAGLGVLSAPEDVWRTLMAPSTILAFLGVVVFYTPLNAALLTLLSGLVGGCASHLTLPPPPQAGETPEERRRRQLSEVFRRENPAASMLRGFLVYLAFIAGTFLATNDPFKDPTPDQYVRVAGLLSFAAFVVGYDPTRIQSILARAPRGPRPADE